MDFDTYKILHSETIMYYQFLENDLKLIYSKMLGGDFDENYDTILDAGLGKIINALKQVDTDYLISDDDYNFLSQIKNNRNYWAHNNFLDFIYFKDWGNSKEYQNSCRKLQKDHDRVEVVYKNVEQIRLNYFKD